VEPETVQKFWQMGLDTHEIALRTGFKESEVYRHLARWLDRKWLERRYDQNRVGSSS
jgi:DNA-binding IclR family transcriptional regulator